MMKPVDERTGSPQFEGSSSRFTHVVALMSSDDEQLAVFVASLFRYLLHTQPSLAETLAQASLPQLLHSLCCVDGGSELLSPNQCAASVQFQCAMSVFVGFVA